MAYTVLARRYRSGTFDEVIGQEHIAQTLKKAIVSGRIAHAYLFCGTRGTGKTSTARILAKCLNCSSFDAPTPTPCNKCDSCLAVGRGDDIDVIEVDAASNTGVDNVRDIIENSRYRPARSRFKVYIIDEVHMLSKSAFNALLKTLEEPPSHVKFILATTEPEKVLPTILSRCQRYDFRNIPTREIAEHLKQICVSEKIKADEDALLLIARAGAGSMRDSLSLLDRLLSVGEDHLTSDMIEQLLGMPKSQLIADLAGAVGESDVKGVLAGVQKMIQSGLSADTLIASLVDHFRNLLILRACGPDPELVDFTGIAMEEMQKQAGRFDPGTLAQDIAILEELRRNLRTTQAGRALLDATMVRLAMADQFTSIDEAIEQVDSMPAERTSAASAQKKTAELARVQAQTSSSAGVASPVVRSAPVVEPLPPSTVESSPIPTTAASPVAPSIDDTGDDDNGDDLPAPGKVWTGPNLADLARAAVKPASTSNIAPANQEYAALWQQLIAKVSGKVPGLAGMLESGQLADVSDGRALIRFPQSESFRVLALQRNGKKEILKDAITELLGDNTGIAFELDASPIESKRKSEVETRPAEAERTRAIVESPAAPPPDPSIRITAELRQSLYNSEPLIRAIVEELGGEIVRVE